MYYTNLRVEKKQMGPRELNSMHGPLAHEKDKNGPLPTGRSVLKSSSHYAPKSIQESNLLPHFPLSVSLSVSPPVSAMKSARKLSFSSSASSPTATATVTVTSPDEQFIPPPPPNITLHLQPNQAHSRAATKIQSAYRAHLIRTLYKTISTVDSAADRLQRRIQRQDTVDALRGSPLERARIDEELMRLLLRLDSVPGGIDPALREGRRKVSRRIVGLQEIVDGVCCGGGAAAEGVGGDNWWGWCERVEEEVCRERGGEELERYCANYLGFRCLERFLHEP